MIRFSPFPRHALVYLLLLSSLPAADAADRLPVEAWGALPRVFSVSLSPDGTRIALARNLGDGAQVAYATEIATGKRLAGATLRSTRNESEQPLLRRLSFANNDRLVYLTQATFSQMRGLPPEAIAPGVSRIDYWHSGILDLDTGKSRLISRKERNDWGIAFLELITPVEGEPDKGRMVLRSSPYQDGLVSVYTVSLPTGNTRLYRRGNSATEDWAFGPGGEPVARVDVNNATNRWSLYAINADDEALVMSDTSDTGSSPFVGITEQGEYAFVDSLPGGEHDVVYTVKAGSTAKTPRFAHPGFDVDEVIIDVWRNTVVGALVTSHFPEQHFFDATLASVYRQLVERLPDALVLIESWSEDRQRFIVYIETGGDAGGYYLYEPGKNELKLLSMRYPDLKGQHLGERSGITFPARDGTRVPAYLTKPSDHDAGPLPTVLLVHGGPVSRDTLAFHWWASFLASRGYLVVQPNYRGSGGYGDQWERAGHGQWGKLMQDDVEDAAHALVHAGMADPARICIVGASFGGYSTLVGATRTPDLFRCAASIAGVSDLPQMLKITRMRAGRDSGAVDWWKMLIGDPDKDRDAIEAASPAFQAHKAKAPILLIHGANDTVVPIDQSERMEAALRRAGKDVEFIRFPGEDHWLSDGSTRIAMLKELERFLAQHLRSGDATPKADAATPQR